MSGLPLRKDGRLYSGRHAATMLALLCETEWADGLPSLGTQGINDGMVRNEIETLAKQRDSGYALAHSTLETARRMVQAVEAILPVFEEAEVAIEVRYERAREALTDLVETFNGSGLLSPDIDRVLETMDDPWKTRAEPDATEPTNAEASQAVEGYDGDATGVCTHCHQLIRRMAPEDAWHHVTTGSLGCV